MRSISMCRDLLLARLKQHASIKACIHDDTPDSPVLNEVRMHQRLLRFAETGKEDPGTRFTRLANNVFEVAGPYGRHFCLASKPQGASLRALQEAFPSGMLPKPLVKSLIQRLFFSLYWLHETCGVVHTGTPVHVSSLANHD